MVLGLFFRRATDESRTKTSAEMGKRTSKVLDLPLGLNMFDPTFNVENGREVENREGKKGTSLDTDKCEEECC